MNTKTMEGLVGAAVNLKLTNTPMRVYKEAERKGNTSGMERAMGYVAGFTEEARKYKAKAEEGTSEEAKELRKKAEEAREQAAKGREEEQEGKAKRAENKETDTVEVSEEGKRLLEESRRPDTAPKGEDSTQGKPKDGI